MSEWAYSSVAINKNSSCKKEIKNCGVAQERKVEDAINVLVREKYGCMV